MDVRYRGVGILAFLVIVLVCGCSPTGAEAGSSGLDRTPPGDGGAPSEQTGEPSRRTSSPSGPGYRLCAEGLPKTGMWKCDPVLADVNGDGRLDVAGLPRLGNGPAVWIQQADGTWRESSRGLREQKRSCGGGLAVGDVNGDGHADLAAGDHCHGISVYLGDGKGRWSTVVRGLIPPLVPEDHPRVDLYRGAEDLAMGDVNGDGHPDLVTGASDEGGINLFFGDGTGITWNWSDDALPKTGWANRVAIADVNGDGRPDIAASKGEGPRVWLQQADGKWEDASKGLPSPMVRGLYTGLSPRDLNGDGRVDLAVANWVDGPEVFFQQPGGTWKKAKDVFPEMKGGAYGLDTGDANRDGHMDIVVSGRLNLEGGYVRGVFLLLGDGKGQYRFASESGLPTTGLAATAGVTLGDINGDGALDVAAGSGLIVETAEGPTEPSIPERLLVWCATSR